jgi:hypothetical protein
MMAILGYCDLLRYPGRRRRKRAENTFWLELDKPGQNEGRFLTVSDRSEEPSAKFWMR